MASVPKETPTPIPILADWPRPPEGVDKGFATTELEADAVGDVGMPVCDTGAVAVEDDAVFVREGAAVTVDFAVARMLLTALSGMRAWPRIANCPWRLSSQHVLLTLSLVRGQKLPSEQLLSCMDLTPTPEHHRCR